MKHPFIIAEAGVNHDGSIDRALELVDAAAAAGADAVKFQTFRTEALVSRDAPKAKYQEENDRDSRTQFEMLQRLELDEAAHRRIAARCTSHGIEFMSTPFDLGSLTYLVEGLNVRRIKLGSGELTNAPLLLAAGRSGKPIVLSTGMATMAEVEAALGVLAFGVLRGGEPPSIDRFRMAFEDRRGQAVLQQRITLLHCVTAYPAPVDQVNLRAIPALRERFGLSVGYSDHTKGVEIAFAAAALGAVMLEKHLTMSRSLPGPDHCASLEPAEFARLVSGVREIAAALGDGNKRPMPAELPTIAIARKGLVALKPIRRGETFTNENLGVKRPAAGASPFEFWARLGAQAARDYAADDPIM